MTFELQMCNLKQCVKFCKWQLNKVAMNTKTFALAIGNRFNDFYLLPRLVVVLLFAGNSFQTDQLIRTIDIVQNAGIIRFRTQYQMGILVQNVF